MIFLTSYIAWRSILSHGWYSNRECASKKVFLQSTTLSTALEAFRMESIVEFNVAGFDTATANT